MPARSARGALAVPAAAAILAVATLAASSAQAKTYFLSASGRDSNSGQQNAPWSSFFKAWQALDPGDTLVVGDGSYSRASPPPGKSGFLEQYITVQAANPGRARLDGLAFKGNSFLAFVGFRIEGGESAVGVGSNGPGKTSHHLTFQQIGFSCKPGTLNDEACFAIGDGSHHVLLEDSWGWGGGRYTVVCYGGPGGHPANLTCDHNTFRRVVLRMGPARSSGGNPQASLSLYYAAHNIVENVIAIDGTASSDSSNSAFYITGHEPPPNSDGNRFLGVIALKNLGIGFYLDCAGADCNAAEVRDSVFWAPSRIGIAITASTGRGGSCANAVIDHNTIAFSGTGLNGYENYACRNATLTNNAFYSNSAFGAKQSPSGGSTTTIAHNGYHGNGKGARENLSSGSGDVSSNPGFAYITRIEPSSPWHNAGSPGDIGANVVNRYEDGKLTARPLWPWPNEERLRAEMCAEPTGDFCASGKSLTRYIWEYLGKPVPPGIYPRSP